MTASGEIRFHRLADEFGSFTNFARYPIMLDGRWWPTAEHYFQAGKFADLDYAERIRTAGALSTAARMGRTRVVPLRANWDRVRVDVMRRAVHAKFVQHHRLAARLRDTGDQPLIEDTVGDRSWADGGDGSGLNTNGRILMELRSLLRRPDPEAGRVATCLPGPVSRRAWVLFGDAVVVPCPVGRGRVVVPRAVDRLRAAAAGASATFWWSARPRAIRPSRSGLPRTRSTSATCTSRRSRST